LQGDNFLSSGIYNTLFSNIQFTLLNWEIFPTGKTFDIGTFRTFLDNHILKHFKTEFERVENKSRFEAVLKHKPDFMAKGREGMQGYVVFGFEKSKLYICESVWTGNATYVFRGEWQEFTKLSRKQIRSSNLAFIRIIHSSNWEITLDRCIKVNK
jgi:hypothetical protein